MTRDYYGPDGELVTGDMLDQLAARAASGDLLVGVPGPVHYGRLVAKRSVPTGMITVHIDSARRAKVDKLAARMGVTPSQLFRDLLDAVPV